MPFCSLQGCPEIWGSAIRPTVAKALGLAQDKGSAYEEGVLERLNASPFPSPDWAAAFDLVAAEYPDLHEGFQAAVERFVICEKMSNQCFQYAFSLSDKMDHLLAIYSAAVLWDAATELMGKIQPRLDWDHVLTAHGIACQEEEFRPLRDELRERVTRGEEIEVTRVVFSHSSFTTYAHYWSLTPPKKDLPTSPEAIKAWMRDYGIPPDKVGFPAIIRGHLSGTQPWIIRPSGPQGSNPGGAPEVVGAWASVIIKSDDDWRGFLYRFFHSF